MIRAWAKLIFICVAILLMVDGLHRLYYGEDFNENVYFVLIDGNAYQLHDCRSAHSFDYGNGTHDPNASTHYGDIEVGNGPSGTRGMDRRCAQLIQK
jgi:hypothetical protein